MIEIELKSVLPHLEDLRRRLARDAVVTGFEGELEDRRYDTADRRMLARDEVLRLRVYRHALESTAQLDWKGPTMLVDGYKQREELSTAIGDGRALATMLDRLGFIVTMAIDRHIWEYEVEGAAVRLERYPHMDDLIEVEGSAADIERAIARLAIPRGEFTSDRLRDFVRRFEARTGERAVLSTMQLPGGADFDTANA
jgi:predicted adenylyl cyclase CyaB